MRSEVDPWDAASDAEEPWEVMGLLAACRSAELSFLLRENSDNDDGLFPNDEPPGLSPPDDNDSRDVSTMNRGSMSHCFVDDMPLMKDVPAIPG